MPQKINQEKAEKYKTRLVGKYLEEYATKEVEQLPYNNLKGLWSQGKYKEFLENALDRLKLLQILPELCPTLDLSVEEEVRKHLQDIDKALRTFKKYFSSQNKDIREETVSWVGKQLPTDLRKLFLNGEWEKFRAKVLKKFDIKLKLSKCLFVICPFLGLSREREVHELVQQLYLLYYCDDQEITDVTESGDELVPDNWLENWGKRIVKRRQKERILQAADLASKLKKRLRDNHYVCDEKVLTFEVESEFRRKCQETPELQDGSLLLKAAKKFLSSIGIWLKLDGQFRRLPAGVYFLFYIEEEELYPGSFIIGSQSVPVYVGMSASDISTRLRDHRAKIGRAKDLDVADFAVKVMFVDNRHYAPCIEGMFIEDFVPVWNRETLGISFGSQKHSLWEKYHVDKDPDVCKDFERKLNISGGHSESESESESASESESVSTSASESASEQSGPS